MSFPVLTAGSGMSIVVGRTPKSVVGFSKSFVQLAGRLWWMAGLWMCVQSGAGGFLFGGADGVQEVVAHQHPLNKFGKRSPMTDTRQSSLCVLIEARIIKRAQGAVWIFCRARQMKKSQSVILEGSAIPTPGIAAGLRLSPI